MIWGRDGRKEAIEQQIELAAPGSDAEKRAEFQGLSWRQKRERLWKSYHPEGPQPVDPWPALASLYYAWFGLGRDFNGVTLFSERRGWLDENGWTEAGEREARMYLFSALEGEAAKIHQKLYPPKRN